MVKHLPSKQCMLWVRVPPEQSFFHFLSKKEVFRLVVLPYCDLRIERFNSFHGICLWGGYVFAHSFTTVVPCRLLVPWWSALVPSMCPSMCE